MKKLLLICAFVALTGCTATVPVKMDFPLAPDSLMTPAEPLDQITKPNPKLSDIIENDSNNAGKYYQLREKYRAWQDWYTQQKKIFESVK
jgi:hypothetical protein